MTNDPGGHRSINRRTLTHPIRHPIHSRTWMQRLIVHTLVMRDAQGNIVKAFQFGGKARG